VKEKVKFYPNKQGVSVRGSEWTLWIRRVKDKDGNILYAVKPLKACYNPEKHTFHYENMGNTIWLNPKELDTLISTLIQISETEKGCKA